MHLNTVALARPFPSSSTLGRGLLDTLSRAAPLLMNSSCPNAKCDWHLAMHSRCPYCSSLVCTREVVHIARICSWCVPPRYLNCAEITRTGRGSDILVSHTICDPCMIAQSDAEAEQSPDPEAIVLDVDHPEVRE